MESNASAGPAIPGAELHGPGQGAPEARAVTPEGDVVLLAPAGSPAARAVLHARGDGLAAGLEITDVAPVAVPYRVRGRAWMAGRRPVRGAGRAACAGLPAGRHPSGPLPGAVWTPLQLEVGEAYADDLWGEGHVEPEEFAAAEPDPLVHHETGLLQHLVAARGPQVRGLYALPGGRARACGTWDRVVPPALDRFGLRVRFCAGGRGFDARFDFPRPVRDTAGLRRAVHALFETASAD